MAGLLDSARDFERWLAAIEAQRPISHPQRLDPREMYRIWLQQKMEEDDKMLQFMRQPAPYQAAQMPAALREASAKLSMGTGQWGQPRVPQPGAPGDFAARMTGPTSRNVIDERTPISADDVTNWLRNTRPPGDIDWKW